MNTDLINRLRTYIYATTEAKDLAAEIIQILERNYPCEAVFAFKNKPNHIIGDIAKAIGTHTQFVDGFHDLRFTDTDRDIPTSILIRSTYQPN